MATAAAATLAAHLATKKHAGSSEPLPEAAKAVLTAVLMGQLPDAARVALTGLLGGQPKPEQQQAVMTDVVRFLFEAMGKASGGIGSEPLRLLQQNLLSEAPAAWEKGALQGANNYFGMLTSGGRAAVSSILHRGHYPAAAAAIAAAAKAGKPEAQPLALGLEHLGLATEDIKKLTAQQVFDNSHPLVKVPFERGAPSIACTQYVTWLLMRTGLLDQPFQRGTNLQEHLRASGKWDVLPPETPLQPGDVVRVGVDTNVTTDVGHTVLAAGADADGKPLFLGAHYPNNLLGEQVVELSRLDGHRISWVARRKPDAR